MILDNFLTQMAKGINAESFVIPSHLAFATSVNTVTAGMTTITGEVPTRIAAPGSRLSTVVTFSGTRPAASASALGQPLVNLSLWSSSTGGTVLSAITIPTVLQTTTFDVYTEYSIEVARRS
jgi:hypothetical protein